MLLMNELVQQRRQSFYYSPKSQQNKFDFLLFREQEELFYAFLLSRINILYRAKNFLLSFA